MIHAAEITISDAAAIATAGGTLVLAGMTYFLGRETRVMAQETRALAGTSNEELELLREQATAATRHGKLAEVALNASIRPVLVDADTDSSPIHVLTNETVDGPNLPYVQISVPVRNVGPGVAMLESATLFLPPTEATGQVTRAEWSRRQSVAAGETAYLDFEVRRDHEAWHDMRRAAVDRVQLSFQVTYADLSGEQASQTHMTIRGDRHGRYVVDGARVETLRPVGGRRLESVS